MIEFASGDLGKRKLSGLATGEPDDPATKNYEDRTKGCNKPGCIQIRPANRKAHRQANLKIFCGGVNTEGLLFQKQAPIRSCERVFWAAITKILGFFRLTCF